MRANKTNFEQNIFIHAVMFLRELPTAELRPV